jgi:hypothetical protein
MRIHERAIRAFAGLATCGVLVLAAAGAAGAAGGAGTTHDSSIEHNATDTFFDVVPCHPEMGGYQITITYNAQFHDTQNKNGDWATGTQTGTFSAVPIEFTIGPPTEEGNPTVVPVLGDDGNPIPRAGESFTGHFTQWFGGSVNPNNSVFTDTFTVHGSGSGGTTFRAHFNDHIVFGPGEPFNPDTLVKVSFNKANCS